MSDLDLGPIDAHFADFFAAGSVPGLAYGVVVDDHLVHARGLGRLDLDDDRSPDADTVFRIASMTKSFTAAAVLALRDQGRLRLDDAVVEHLPEFERGLSGPTADSAPVTVRDLLTMGAGLPTDDPWGDRQQDLGLREFDALVASGLSRTGPADGPFEYSNLGFALLGRLITQVTDRPYDEVVDALVLRPLRLESTGFHDDRAPADRRAMGYAQHSGEFVAQPLVACGAFAPMGGLVSSVRDLARWMTLFLSAEPARDDPDPQTVLRRSSLRQMQQPRRFVEAVATAKEVGGPTRLVASSYAYGLVVDDDAQLGRFVSHSGGYPGFGSHMRWHHGSGIGVVALANRTYAPMRTVAAQALEGALASRPRRTGAAWASTTKAEDVVEQLLGAWDDALADEWFAMNMDLDQPRQLRRQEAEQVAAVHGVLRRDPAVPIAHLTPAHSRWWLVGDRGRVRVDLLMSPEALPRIQAISLTSVPAPPDDLLAAARSVAAEVLGVLDPAGASGGGRPDVGPVVGGDGAGRASFAVDGQPLTLEVRRDGGEIQVRVVPVPQRVDAASWERRPQEAGSGD